MVASQVAFTAFIGLLVLERLFEMWLSRRNAAWALNEGGIERGQRHFRWMKTLHTLFFVACVAEVYLLERPFVARVGLPLLALALVAQGLRYWAIGALGRRWNVRVIVLPGAPPVTSGPYRFVRHPNYVAVAIELAVVPLIHGAWLTAVLFSLANVALMVVRIRCEEETLATHSDYAATLGRRARFVPWLMGYRQRRRSARELPAGKSEA
jgi:methyltransferase